MPLLFPFLSSIVTTPEQAPNFSASDVVALIQQMKKLDENDKTILNTLAILTQQMIDLRVDVGTWAQESSQTRLIRNSSEQEALEAQLSMIQKRIDSLKNGPEDTGKIKATVRREIATTLKEQVGDAVKVELKKTSIDWNVVRQNAVNYTVGGLMFALVLKVIQMLSTP